MNGWSREEPERVAVGDLVADEGLRLGDDLAHAGVDALEVVGDERAAVGQLEVVVEAVLDGRADGEGGAGEQVEHGLGQHVGRRVADREQAPRRLVLGDDGDLVAVGERRCRGRARSPLTSAITAALASREPMAAARSPAVVPAGNARVEPSGSVIVISSAMGPEGTGAAVPARNPMRASGRLARARRRSTGGRRPLAVGPGARPSAVVAVRRASAPGVTTSAVSADGKVSAFLVAYSSTYSWPESSRISNITSSMIWRSTSRSSARSA